MVASEHHLVLGNAQCWSWSLSLFGYIITIVGEFVFHLDIVFTQLKKFIHLGSSKLVSDFCSRSNTRIACGNAQLQANYLSQSIR